MRMETNVLVSKVFAPNGVEIDTGGDVMVMPYFCCNLLSVGATNSGQLLSNSPPIATWGEPLWFQLATSYEHAHSYSAPAEARRSETTPAAVTSGPAPGPCTMSGYSR
jgi:hypothetical protein